MVGGGRDLEQEIMDSFFEELERDESIPSGVVSKLRNLETESQLTDADKVIAIAQEGTKNENSED
jgi:hypothetical protein